jgi:hypothetical protein
MTRLTPRFKHMEVPNAIKVVPGSCHCPHNTDNIVGDQSIDFLAKSAFTFMNLPPPTRISAVINPQVLGGNADGAWFDLRGHRVEASSGASNPLLPPGIYFHKPESALAKRK